MQFLIEKNARNEWDLIPTSGIFSGQVIAHVEGVLLIDARFSEDGVMGQVKALWGIADLNPDVYEDPSTLRGLRLNRAFKNMPTTPVVIDRDGFKCRLTLRRIKSAKCVMIMGSACYAEGYV